MYLQKENVVVVTQHVKNIASLSDEQNDQLQRYLEYGDQDVQDAPAVRSVVSKGIKPSQKAEQESSKSVTGKAKGKKKNQWVVYDDGTRALARHTDGEVAFDLEMRKNGLYLQVVGYMNERKSRRCTDGIAAGRDGRRGASRRAEWHAATFSSEDGPFGVRQY